MPKSFLLLTFLTWHFLLYKKEPATGLKPSLALMFLNT